MNQERQAILDTIFDEISKARSSRDASARVCAEELLNNDLEKAQWHANQYHAQDAYVEELMAKMNEQFPDK